MKELKDLHAVSPNCEITLEVNPGASEHAQFPAYKDAGITRISLGVQSFQADKLKRLGRVHDREDAILAIEAIKNARFASFNIDLMYGLPTQTHQDMISDLTSAKLSGVPHLSWYHLTLEPNTAFHHKPPPLPEPDTIADFQEWGEKFLQPDFSPYEVSAFARDPSHRCRHNLNYWEFGDYLGVGAGSHGKLTCPNSGLIERTIKAPHPKNYLSQAQPLVEKRIVESKQLPFEFMLNALRLKSGFNLELFYLRTRLTHQVLVKPLQLAEQQGFIELSHQHLSVTTHGMQYLNDLMMLFV